MNQTSSTSISTDSSVTPTTTPINQITSPAAVNSPQLLFQNLSQMISDLLIVLSPKEKYIIEHRFGLGNLQRETLERIGKHFRITRERVRQIETNAIKKLQRTSANTNLKIINEYACMLMQKNGSLMPEEKLILEIINAIQSKNPEDISAIQLCLSLEKNIEKNFNTINFRPYWRLNNIKHQLIEELSQKIIGVIEKRKEVTSLDELLEQLPIKSQTWPTKETYSSILEISKNTKITPEQTFGLTAWRHINPRTIKDKISYILNKENRPMHFMEIAERIIESKFDHKKVNVQAVHNELIRNSQFILIGRGIYALENWGYKKGTVREVIEEILSDGKPHSQQEIIEKVLQQRKIKKITILLNLKNKKKFERVGRYTYQLKKN